jgi:hypothetical protein
MVGTRPSKCRSLVAAAVKLPRASSPPMYDRSGSTPAVRPIANEWLLRWMVVMRRPRRPSRCGLMTSFLQRGVVAMACHHPR